MARTRPTSTKRQREFDKKRKKQEKLDKKKRKSIENETTKTNNGESNVGKEVISLDFGVGTISSIESLNGDNSKKYYVIEHGNKNSRNLYPVCGNKNIRFLSSERDFLNLLEGLKEKESTLPSFESKKDRLESFKATLLQAQNVDKIAEGIVELSSLKDLSPVEQKIYDKLINSIALEANLVLNIKKHESRDYILDHLKHCQI